LVPVNATPEASPDVSVTNGGPDHGVPDQIAVPHLSASAPGRF